MARMTLRPGPALAAVAVLALVGCDSIGNPLKVLDAKREGPDEFQVIARAPLVTDTTGGLPAPRLGAPSPLDPRPKEDARRLLLGPGAGPTPRTAPPGTQPGEAESALITAARNNGGEPITQAEAAKPRKPFDDGYEPPTIGELLSSGSDDGFDDVPEGDRLDAQSEARRLQRQGLAAPNDPNETAGDEAESGDGTSVGGTF